MYTLLVFKENDQRVEIEEGSKSEYDGGLEVHYIKKDEVKDQVWIRLYNVTEFPTLILMNDRKEIGRTSIINYESNYDIKCWIRNMFDKEGMYD